MKKFEYVKKDEWIKTKNELIELIKLVQDEVRDFFTFRFDFIGSSSRKMITCDYSSNIGYDFDVNIEINFKCKEDYSPKSIKRILKNGFDKYVEYFKYDFCEDSKRVLTIKVKDRKNSKILHSCDFAIVKNYFEDDNEYQEYIHFNKNNNTYEWKRQPSEYYRLDEKIEWIKENRLWNEVRRKYIINKNSNNDIYKKSRSIFAETISQVYNEVYNEN